MGNLGGKHGGKRHIWKISGGIPFFYMKYCARWCEIKNIRKNRKKQENSGKVGKLGEFGGETTWKFPGPRLLCATVYLKSSPNKTAID
jgi:hypothetical protein